MKAEINNIPGVPGEVSKRDLTDRIMYTIKTIKGTLNPRQLVWQY